MTNPKITRKDADRALFDALCVVARCAAGEDGGICEKCESTGAILRQCRIIEPGGLDAETWLEARKAVAALLSNEESLTGAINVSTWHEVMDYMRARADAIEKGE